jgi:hypothetical protein
MIMSFSQIDILPSTQIFTALFTFKDSEFSSPLNVFFQLYQFDTKNSLLNMGSTFIFALIVFSSLFVLLLADLLNRFGILLKWT